jgi:hypothetical protein
MAGRKSKAQRLHDAAVEAIIKERLSKGQPAFTPREPKEYSVKPVHSSIRKAQELWAGRRQEKRAASLHEIEKAKKLAEEAYLRELAQAPQAAPVKWDDDEDED